MTFEKELLGTASQEAVLRLHEAEIRLLEFVRTCILERVNCERAYAKSLAIISTRSLKVDYPLNTPLITAWTEIMRKTEALSEVVQQQADIISSSTVDRLAQLIADRKTARQMFLEEKVKFEQELAKAKNEIARQHSEYSKAMMKVKQKQTEFEKSKIQAKTDDVKRKYIVLTDKLHRVHNDYVVAIVEGKELQSGLQSSVIPMYMRSQQEYCQGCVTQCKSILADYLDQTEICSKEFQALNSTMKRIVMAVNPETEYVDFIAKYRSNPWQEQLGFDAQLLQGYTGNLRPEDLTVDDLTYETLVQIQNKYAHLMKSMDKEILASQQNVDTASKELSSLPADFSKPDVLLKKRNLYFQERRLKELNLFKQREEKIHSMISERLSAVQPSNLPLGLDVSSGAQENGEPSSRAGHSMKATLSKIKERLTSVTTNRPDSHSPSKRDQPREDYCVVLPGDRTVKMTADPNSPLAEEEWFHGILPREEVQRLLKHDGDYLVRESKKKGADDSQYVLSVMWQGPKHFIIQYTESGWRLEGQACTTVQQLIINQHKSGTVVTNKSQAILRNPIMRETWQIKNDDIELEEKIGSGNFGDVFRGSYKGQIVAVKTCKEELSEEQKKRFIVEGRILREYDHANIVKFVGIGAQRNPVMIVMEFVAGGALLSWLRKNAATEDRKQLVKMCEDAASGMAYLESKGVIHRDLAARNCLISENKVVKISDFGMSKEEEVYIASGGMRQIPIKWTAPEALNYGKYTCMCDVWSFGVLMWEVFSGGKTPYPGMKNQEARDKVDAGYRMPAPEGCPTAIYSLMRDCWEAQPEKRPHFAQIVTELNHCLNQFHNQNNQQH